MTDTIPVGAFSPAAEAILAAHPRGKVHSVYARTANLLCGERLLVSLTASTDEVHPFSLCTSAGALPGFSPGAGYVFRDGCLQVEDALFLLSGGRRPELSLSPPSDRQTLLDTARRLLPAGEAWAPRSSLGFLLFPGQASPLAYWGTALDEFSRALVRGDIPRAVVLGEDLFGMGWGLTPSVDDFCVGLLAAAHCARAGQSPRVDFSPLADAAWGRTSLVSGNFLFHACHGLFTSTLLMLVAALSRGDAGAASAAAERLVSFGHSSGTDMLLGLLYGLKLLLEE